MMRQPQMRLYTLYLPLTGEESQPLPQLQLQWAREEIMRFAGGCTLLPPSNGLWVAPDGLVCYTCVMPIQVVAPARAESEYFFARLASQLAARLNQQEIFILSLPVSVVAALSLTSETRVTRVEDVKTLFDWLSLSTRE